MCTHTHTQMDKNGDGMVSLAEFMQYTDDPAFKQDDEWKSVVEEEPPFDDQEFKKFEVQTM